MGSISSYQNVTNVINDKVYVYVCYLGSGWNLEG